MGNVLSKNIPANTRYTEFENNQVLTADQLNDLFLYLDIQTRLTRTRGIGVGIICGLEIGLTADNTIVVSKGAAITTDGDLLQFSNDQVFDQYSVFEDTNARYDYFHLDNGNQVPLYVLSNSRSRTSGKPVSGFNTDTNTSIKDYAGILYLEDYNNNTDTCTGVDCDNKGIECVRELKVLIANKDSLSELLGSIPKMNREYFSLDDMVMPRVLIKNNITKYEELQGAFSGALTIKDTLVNNLAKAYQVCKPIIEDDLDADDTIATWKQLIESYSSQQSTIYVQYLYDFFRDLVSAYNEMKESLFNDDHLCCPPVELFPKHILLGLIKTATIKRPILTALNPATVAVAQPANRLPVLDLSPTIRFDIASLIRRFHPVQVDITYRHSFYASPVLNNNESDELKTRFFFKRIDTMIRTFSVPATDSLKNVQAIKITPTVFEEQKIGNRAIPYYYRYDRSRAINAYWNYDANARNKEDSIYYYFASQYSSSTAAKNPLQFNLLPYSFFRIEGHIGFKYPEVERALNQVINDNNLPINLVTVQVEPELRTIPDRNWWFPHLHVYEQFVRNTLIDHINQVDLVHANLKPAIENDPDIGKISLAMNNFSNVKARIQSQPNATTPQFNIAGFKKDVQDLITATNDIKANTQKFTFSNTAAPHDFIINTDILHKTDGILDMLNNHILIKKQNLFLGNFMVNNPGLEHAGGVLRGGTFVLVYTSNNNVVVADFMLPYASVDKDIVTNPPTIKPLPLPDFPQYQIPKIFERIPLYQTLIDQKALDVSDKIKLFDDRLGQKLSDLDSSKKVIDDKVGFFDSKISDVEGRLNQRLTDINTTKDLFNANVQLFQDKIKTVDTFYNSKLADIESKLDYQGKIFTSIASVIPDTKLVANPGGTRTGGLVINGKDLTADATLLKQLSKDVETLQPNTPDRIAKEAQIAEVAKRITDATAQPNLTLNAGDETAVKSVLFDAQAATNKILSQNNQQLRATITDSVNKASLNINTRFR